MVAVAMKLGLAREKLGGMIDGTAQADLERVLELVDAAHRGAKEAITELRDLARGIHPPVLDQGLGAALATLAARSERARRARHRPARAPFGRDRDHRLLLRGRTAHQRRPSTAAPGMPRWRRSTCPGCCGCGSSDDGSGGARIEARGGLAGLAERVRTVDGRLQVSSPPEGPTVVTVELPSHA